MLRFNRLFKTPSDVDAAKQILDLLLIKLAQKKLERKSSNALTPGEVVKCEYYTSRPKSKESYNHALNTLATVLKNNINFSDYDNLNLETKKQILNMLANETFSLFEKQFFFKYVSSTFSMPGATEKFDTTTYRFNFDLYGRTQLESMLIEQLQPCFEKIKLLIKPEDAENKPATPGK